MNQQPTNLAEGVKSKFILDKEPSMESINQSYFLVASPEFLISPTKIAVCW